MKNHYAIIGTLVVSIATFGFFAQTAAQTPESYDDLPIFDPELPGCVVKKMTVRSKVEHKKPTQHRSGRVPAVVKYINDNYNDPYSVKYVEWSELTEVEINGLMYWKVTLKHRAKNAFGAYILKTDDFFIYDNSVELAYNVMALSRLAGTAPPTVTPLPGDKEGDEVYEAYAMEGESTEQMAVRCKVNVDKLVTLNDLAPQSVFAERKRLRLPKDFEPAKPITGDFIMLTRALKDETLEAFADRHLSDPEVTSKINKLQLFTVLKEGQKYKILVRSN